MQVCTLLQSDNHASTPPLSFFTGWMPFLLPNQQRQSTEGNSYKYRYRAEKLLTCIVVLNLHVEQQCADSAVPARPNSARNLGKRKHAGIDLARQL